MEMTIFVFYVEIKYTKNAICAFVMAITSPVVPPLASD